MRSEFAFYFNLPCAAWPQRFLNAPGEHPIFFLNIWQKYPTDSNPAAEETAEMVSEEVRSASRALPKRYSFRYWIGVE